MGLLSNGYTLSASGPGAPLIMGAVGEGNQPAQFPPGILVTLSNGAVLTYSVEICGDVQFALQNWNTLDTAGGQAASGNWTLAGAVTAIRLNISSYTSGSATFNVVRW